MLRIFAADLSIMALEFPFRVVVPLSLLFEIIVIFLRAGSETNRHQPGQSFYVLTYEFFYKKMLIELRTSQTS